MADEVFVKHGEYVLPFSPWRLTQSIMPTGIHPEMAYALSKEIGDAIKAQGKRFVKPTDITKLIESHLDKTDPKLPERYNVWHRYRHLREEGKLKQPMLILLGGATGTGKSSVALEVAHRLGIRNVIGTDYVRQILRTMFSEEILPDIYMSSFDAWQALKVPIAPGEDKIAIGYVEQVKHVSVGIEAIVSRAMKEGTDVLLEGIHILPGILQQELADNPTVTTIALSVENADEHKVRLSQRGKYSARSPEEYLSKFDAIRKIQSFIIAQASTRGVPVINNLSFDKTVESIIEKTTHNVRKIVKR